MSIFRSAANVRIAASRARAARHCVGQPVALLLARGRKFPLTTVGSAAGAGFVLGSLNIHPLRVPGLSALMSGSVAAAMAHGAKLIAELGVMGMGAAARGAATDDGGSPT